MNSTIVVECLECATSTDVPNYMVAIDKVKRHHSHYGCTFPDEQAIRVNDA